VARAVELAAVVGAERVDAALGLAAIAGRFADGDLASIVDHLAAGRAPGELVIADEWRSCSRSTPTASTARPPPPTSASPTPCKTCRDHVCLAKVGLLGPRALVGRGRCRLNLLASGSGAAASPSLPTR
jgi:hypothetical protein